ncbi:hypothetical protein NQF87_01785 [Bombella sp. TMW 2.2559]|uniref:Uncharacterized protein n=1 Tax=Bombella dulcis TaxID=2967339 RepID=A0ABT3W9E2_9PROT|nr:hypothetical protein [Bombella dulcis]MCX5615712.1 hypothetical protein [Bombella dulcis]
MERFNCVFLNKDSGEKIFACLELRDNKNILLRAISSNSERGWKELSGIYEIGEGETFKGKGNYLK